MKTKLEQIIDEFMIHFADRHAESIEYMLKNFPENSRLLAKLLNPEHKGKVARILEKWVGE